jgi:hypothetical protein
MRKSLIFLLTLTSLLNLNNGFSQERKISPQLMNIKDIFGFLAFDRNDWDLYGHYNDEKYTPIKAENVIDDIDKYISKPPTTDRHNGDIKEFNLIKKYRNNFDSAFNELKLLGIDQLGEFFYTQDISLPIHFGLYGDTALSIIISGAYIDNVYNTLKLTSKQRATKVITTYILPSLKAFSENFSTKDIKYFGMTCLYGSKDFSSDEALNTKGEYVAFIASSKLIQKYVAGDLTEDDLVDAADIYVSDRDMITEIKKIKIVIE